MPSPLPRSVLSSTPVSAPSTNRGPRPIAGSSADIAVRIKINLTMKPFSRNDQLRKHAKIKWKSPQILHRQFCVKSMRKFRVSHCKKYLESLNGKTYVCKSRDIVLLYPSFFQVQMLRESLVTVSLILIFLLLQFKSYLPNLT